MVKSIIILLTSIEGGGDARACNLSKSLLSIGLKVTGISLSYSVSPYFLKHLSIDFLELLKDRLQKLLGKRMIAISIHPHYTYNLIKVKGHLKRSSIENAKAYLTLNLNVWESHIIDTFEIKGSQEGTYTSY